MLRLHSRALLACALACPGFVLADEDARACGACFHQPPPAQVVDTSLVTDHRMAFSISLTQSVLWDQIRYSGSPGSFAWVLPVHAGARVELSTDAWLAALDASTRTVITGPTPACGGGAPTQYEGSGGGCGSADDVRGHGAGAGHSRLGYAGRADHLGERRRPVPGRDVAVVDGRGARSLAGGQRLRGASGLAAHDQRVHDGGLRLHRAQARARPGRAGDASRCESSRRAPTSRSRCAWWPRASARTLASSSTS